VNNLSDQPSAKMAKIFKYKNGANLISPEECENPHQSDNREAERSHNKIPVVTGIGWVDFQPNETLNEFENDQQSHVSHLGKDPLLDQSDLYSNFIEEAKKKKRRRCRPRSRKRKLDWEFGKKFGNTAKCMTGRGEKRKMISDENNDIDIRPKLSPNGPKSLDPRQVREYVISDPGLSNKRRRIRNSSYGSERNVGTLGRNLGPSPNLVYSPTKMRQAQSEHSAVKWPSFLDPVCKNSSGSWDPLIFHGKTAEKVKKMGMGAASVDVTIGRNLGRENDKEGFDDKYTNFIGILNNRKRTDRSHVLYTKYEGDELWTNSDYHSTNKVLPKLESMNGSFEDREKKRESKREIQNEFKEDIKDIVRKTLSANTKEREIKDLFQSEIENIDSPENFSDTESSEELLNLPNPVPALRNNTGNIKDTSLIYFPVPVPALKKKKVGERKSFVEIIKSMKNKRCRVEIIKSIEVTAAIARDVPMIKDIEKQIHQLHEINQEVCKSHFEEFDKEVSQTDIHVDCQEVDKLDQTEEMANEEFNNFENLGSEKNNHIKVEEAAHKEVYMSTTVKETFKLCENIKYFNILNNLDNINHAKVIIKTPSAGTVRGKADSSTTKTQADPILTTTGFETSKTIGGACKTPTLTPGFRNSMELKKNEQIEEVVHKEDCRTVEIASKEFDNLEYVASGKMNDHIEVVTQTDEANTFFLWLKSENEDTIEEVVNKKEEQIQPLQLKRVVQKELDQDQIQKVTHLDKALHKEVDMIDQKVNDIEKIVDQKVDDIEKIVDQKVDDMEEICDQNVDESEEITLKVDLGEYDVKYCFICQEYDHFMRNDCLVCKGCGEKGHSIKKCSIHPPLIIDEEMIF